MDKRNEGFTSTRVLALMLSGALVCGAGLSAFASDDAMSAFAEDEAVTSSYEAVESEENAPEEDALSLDIVTEEEDPVETEEPDIAIIPEDEPEEQVTEVVSEEESAEENEPEYDPEEEIIEEFFELEEPNPLYEDLVPGDLPEAFEPESETAEEDQLVIQNRYYSWLPSVSAELAGLSAEQKDEIIAIWKENFIVFDDAKDMLAVYDLPYLSREAQYVLTLANIDGHVNFIYNNFSGENTYYLDAYVASYDMCCDALENVCANGLSDPAVYNELVYWITAAYGSMRLAEESDPDVEVFAVANRYWEYQAQADAENLFAVIGRFI